MYPLENEGNEEWERDRERERERQINSEINEGNRKRGKNNKKK